MLDKEHAGRKKHAKEERILKVSIVFTKNIWKEDRNNRSNNSKKELVPSNRNIK